MNKILVIDDEPTIRKLLCRILELEGYEVSEAKDCASGLSLQRRLCADVVLCDVFLPDGNGLKMLPDLLKCSPDSKIVMLTAHGNIADGVQAIKNGAFDYIVKGDDNRKIIPVISRAMEEAGKSGKKPSRQAKVKRASFDSIVGDSRSIRDAKIMARKVAVTDVCVLLTGETGTGKEVFAQAIHELSERKENPFVAINCSAFSRELLESELFGYKAGAFTGALKDKKGLFEEADGGTVFLDEIGEMEMELQAKLLRVLESQEFLKVGDVKPTRVNIRIISATNRNLRQLIASGRFREDLFFRLSVFQITLAPLRERKGDVELLARSFVDSLCRKMGRPSVAITSSCLDLLDAYSWPGNVRELRNAIERALVVCESCITEDDLPSTIIREDLNACPDSGYDLETVEKKHIAKILKYTKGNKTEAARLLKIGLTTLYRKIEEYKIQI